MATTTPRITEQRSIAPDELRALVDVQQGWIDRSIFWDQKIYEMEMERIFARCWIFVAHDSQLPNVGDFVTTYVGEDAVIVARARDGQVHAFINSCSHRGNRVCFAETGNARRFTCNFHGWSYGLDGALAGVTAEGLYKDNPTFDRKKLGLHKARVESYGGMHFATFDEGAPSLADYLGDFRFYLDVLLDNDPGGIEFVDGNIKSRLKCNWKFPAENFIGDAYHATWTHSSALHALFGKVPAMRDDRSFQVNANGHGWEFGLDFVGNAATLGEPEIVEYLRENETLFAERLGKMRSRMVGSLSSATVFPNLSFLAGHNTFRTWNPKGPTETELHTWVFLNKNAPESLKEKYRRGVMLTFSPAGVFEMDDGENFEHCTASNAGVVTRRRPLHTGLGLGSEVEHPELAGHVHRNQVNEANHRAFYQRWIDLMTAPTWADVPAR
jgi:ethylbenzene dioxygenase alpha subunit